MISDADERFALSGERESADHVVDLLRRPCQVNFVVNVGVSESPRPAFLRRRLNPAVGIDQVPDVAGKQLDQAVACSGMQRSGGVALENWKSLAVDDRSCIDARVHAVMQRCHPSRRSNARNMSGGMLPNQGCASY